MVKSENDLLKKLKSICIGFGIRFTSEYFWETSDFEIAEQIFEVLVKATKRIYAHKGGVINFPSSWFQHLKKSLGFKHKTSEFSVYKLFPEIPIDQPYFYYVIPKDGEYSDGEI